MTGKIENNQSVTTGKVGEYNILHVIAHFLVMIQLHFLTSSISLHIHVLQKMKHLLPLYRLSMKAKHALKGHLMGYDPLVYILQTFCHSTEECVSFPPYSCFNLHCILANAQCKLEAKTEVLSVST